MNSDKEASFKTKETLKIQFTHMFIDDNNEKLKLTEKLNACSDKISNVLFDYDVKKDPINVLNEVLTHVKRSCKSCKNKLLSVNLKVKQVEEAFNQ